MAPPPRQPFFAHRGVFALFQPQRGAPDEAAFQLLGKIARILKPQPLQPRHDRLGARARQLLQTRSATRRPWMRRIRPSMKIFDIAQDQTLRQQELEPVQRSAAPEAATGPAAYGAGAPRRTQTHRPRCAAPLSDSRCGPGCARPPIRRSASGAPVRPSAPKSSAPARATGSRPARDPQARSAPA